MENHGNDYQNAPIPTYEEATSSRPHSSRNFQGAEEISADAERQGLLGAGSSTAERETRREGGGIYHAATDRRLSNESDFTLPDDGDYGPDVLRRDMEEMEVEDPETQPAGRRRRLFPKRLTDLTNTISSIHLPGLASIHLPSFTVPTLVEVIQKSLGWPLIGRVIALFAVLALVYGLVIVRIFTWKVMPPGAQYTQESIRGFIQKTVDANIIEGYLYEVSFEDHVAGTKGDYFLAEWVEQRFKDAGLDEVYNDDYEVYLNYPRPDGRRVAIVSPPELVWQAALEEDVVEEKVEQHQVPAFHGHSRSGNVTGPLIYANYGSREDFALLKDRGVDLTGSVVLVRYYGTQGDRALKVKAAELAGAAGCLIYSDPMEDGFTKGETVPGGPWRSRDAVQRGAVSLMSWVVGDVLTPGWASLPDAERISKDDNPGLTNIPSLPLAWRDAQVLLQSLKGCGIQTPLEWVGAVPDVDEWWTGNISDSAVVNLMNLQDENEKQPIRNVIGKIEGYESPEKLIYLGNHRDAWCFGAVDPGSGTAVFVEVVRVFGELLKRGWRPRRSIVFASWDAEEYNLIGSTEHVEDRIDALRANGVAYLNVDVGVSGGQFHASGSPLYEAPLLRVLDRVRDPTANSSMFEFHSLLEAWNLTESKLEGLGAGSDYVAFQDLAGCSSADFGFEGPPNGFPYHSCYETFNWMKTFADPDFEIHAALAQVWALLALELADEPLLPYDFPAYAREVKRYVQDLKDDAIAALRSSTSPSSVSAHLDLTALEEAARSFIDDVEEFINFEDKWNTAIMQGMMIETRELAAYRISHNSRMTYFETHLLDLPLPSEGREGGVPGRTQFKHVIFGPQTWSGYEEAYFPAVRDAIDAGDWVGAQAQVDIVAKVLKHAVYKLLH